MSSKMNVNVSGGSASIGNMVQGDRNKVVSGSVSANAEGLFREFQARLPALAEPYDRTPAEIAQLAHQVEQLRAQATAHKPDVAKGKGLLKTIRENFSWAYPAVKDLLALAWPAVLAALVG